MIKIKESLTYDDVLLVPKYSEISSRSNVDISVSIQKNNSIFNFSHPIVPANMKTITGIEMARCIAESGGMAIVHRFMPQNEQLEMATRIVQELGAQKNIGFSIGVKKEDYDMADKFAKIGVKILCIDIANGDSKLCSDMAKYISCNYPDILLIAGNVATASGAKLLWEAGADIVKVGIGGGCFAAGTRVLMSNGTYKNIEDIKIGDFVINKNGESKKVLNSFCSDVKNVSRLKNNSFYNETYVTPDHNFFVGDFSSTENISSVGYLKALKSADRFGKSKYKWKAIGDANKCTLLFPKKIKFDMQKTFDITINKKSGGNRPNNFTYKKEFSLKPSYELGYILGTFLGDGHAFVNNNGKSKIGSVRWYFGKDEKDIAEKLTACISKKLKKEAKIKEKTKTLDVELYSKPLADFLLSFGKKSNKHLPENLFVKNKKYLMGIYDGLVDSDGNHGKDGRISLTNTSIKIIELFNIINFILKGYLPNNNKRKPSAGGLKNCNILNCKPSFISRTMGAPEYRIGKDFFIVKKTKYEKTEIEVPVYDITVDCNTHSFIANNAIVHNSLCTTRIETGNGVPQLSAISEVYEEKKELEKKLNKKLYFMSDGGIKSVGDITKSLCYSDFVMCGNMFAGADEAPGEILQIDGKKYKSYVGSSTHKENHIEGVAAMVLAKGPTKNILQKIFEGLKSGMSYQGVDNLNDMKKNPEFIKITGAGLKESHAHDVIISK